MQHKTYWWKIIAFGLNRLVLSITADMGNILKDFLAFEEVFESFLDDDDDDDDDDDFISSRSFT